LIYYSNSNFDLLIKIKNLFKYLNFKDINNKIKLIYYSNPNFDLLTTIHNPFEYLNSKNKNKNIIILLM